MDDVCPTHGCEKVRESGRMRCPICRKAQRQRYEQSEKGRRTRRKASERYFASEKGQAALERISQRQKAPEAKAAVRRRRAQDKANGICVQDGCDRLAASDRIRCRECLDKRVAKRAADRESALLAISRTNPPSCGVCGTTDNLEIDHIHNDGHLDVTPRGNRRKGVDSVLKDIAEGRDPREWAQVLCRSHNLEKARRFAR